MAEGALVQLRIAVETSAQDRPIYVVQGQNARGHKIRLTTADADQASILLDALRVGVILGGTPIEQIATFVPEGWEGRW